MNEQLQGATTQTASAQPLFNPLSPDFIRDPYPSYDKLRTHAPVLHLPALNGYLVSRNADAALVLRDKRFGKDYVTRITRRFGPEALNEPVYRAMGRWMLTQDPPDHTRLRGLVVKAFTARRVEDMGYEKVRVRSPLTCEAEQGICTRCYGMDLSRSRTVGNSSRSIAASRPIMSKT